MFGEALAIVAVAVATVFDLRTRRIPDTLSLLVIGVALGHAVDGVAFVLAVSGGAVVLGSALLLERTGHRFGGGDLKMLVAVGALLGPIFGLSALVASLVALRAAPARIERPLGPFLFLGVVVASVARAAF